MLSFVTNNVYLMHHAFQHQYFVHSLNERRLDYLPLHRHLLVLENLIKWIEFYQKYIV